VAEVRTCRLCRETKALETEFYFRKEKGGYYRTECKECIRARQRQYNATHDAPVRTEYHRAWRAANAERITAWRRDWLAANPDKRRQYQMTSYHRNPESYRRAMRKRQQLRRGAPMDAVAHEWWEIVRHDPCAYCGSRERQSLDHIDALARGGDSHWTNLAAACRNCNSAKQDRTILEHFLHRAGVV
jgi:5-methylcytosine-specific restriction endonuclease McrA